MKGYRPRQAQKVGCRFKELAHRRIEWVKLVFSDVSVLVNGQLPGIYALSGTFTFTCRCTVHTHFLLQSPLHDLSTGGASLELHPDGLRSAPPMDKSASVPTDEASQLNK